VLRCGATTRLMWIAASSVAGATSSQNASDQP